MDEKKHIYHLYAYQHPFTTICLKGGKKVWEEIGISWDLQG